MGWRLAARSDGMREAAAAAVRTRAATERRVNGSVVVMPKSIPDSN